MISNIQEAENIALEYNALQFDQERIQYIKSHRNKLKITVGTFTHHADFICDDTTWANASMIDLKGFDNDGQNFMCMLLETCGINAEEE